MPSTIKITFLGTGTSQGVPIIACNCRVCQSTDPRDKRLRSSVLIEVNEKTFVIDTGPDFRYQMLRAKVQRLDAVLYTHPHKDHTAGMDDIRAFNYIQQKAMDIYAEKIVQETLIREFNYVFCDIKYPGVPEIIFHTITDAPFYIDNVLITPIRAMHMNLPILGFRINDFTYLTDINYIESKEIEKIVGSKIVVVNGLRNEKHISHFSLNEAIHLIQTIQPPIGYITHISHQLGCSAEVEKTLPANIYLAYDNLILEI